MIHLNSIIPQNIQVAVSYNRSFLPHKSLLILYHLQIKSGERLTFISRIDIFLS